MDYDTEEPVPEKEAICVICLGAVPLSVYLANDHICEVCNDGEPMVAPI